MRSLTINRGEHLTGKALEVLDRASGLLHDKSGLKCCMGIYCKKLGFTNADLSGQGMPDDLRHDHVLNYPALQEDMKWLDKPLDETDRKTFKDVNTVAWAIARTNDSASLSRRLREIRLAYLFKKYGFITLKFTGTTRTAVARAKKATA